MELYIDKENVHSLMKSKDHAKFAQCESLIRSNMDVHYNFSKEEISKDELLSYWFRQYGEGVVGEKRFCPPESITPERPLKSNFCTFLKKVALSSVYLLDDSRVCDLIAEKSCILIGKVGEEVSIIERLIIDGSETMTSSIKDWDTYCPTLPVTDIIISDNHYFKNLRVYIANENELLKKIASNANSAVNVVIIIKEGEVDRGLNLEEELVKIKQMIKRETNSTKSMVTILTTYQTHDRILFTNYFRIKNGSCFHLKENGLKRDVTTEIKSHAIRANMDISLEMLKCFQEIAKAPANCYGDRKSNYLDFE